MRPGSTAAGGTATPQSPPVITALLLMHCTLGEATCGSDGGSGGMETPLRHWVSPAEGFFFISLRVREEVGERKHEVNAVAASYGLNECNQIIFILLKKSNLFL